MKYKPAPVELSKYWRERVQVGFASKAIARLGRHGKPNGDRAIVVGNRNDSAVMAAKLAGN